MKQAQKVKNSAFIAQQRQLFRLLSRLYCLPPLEHTITNVSIPSGVQGVGHPRKAVLRGQLVESSSFIMLTWLLDICKSSQSCDNKQAECGDKGNTGQSASRRNLHSCGQGQNVKKDLACVFGGVEATASCMHCYGMLRHRLSLVTRPGPRGWEHIT